MRRLPRAPHLSCHFGLRKPWTRIGRQPGASRIARTAGWFDIIAVLVILAAIARFAVLPRLRGEIASIQAPPVSIATLDGGRFDLERRRGHLVLLDFWTTWCPPCRETSSPVTGRRRRPPRPVASPTGNRVTTRAVIATAVIFLREVVP